MQAGATFDGRYIYFPPASATSAPASRYDTQAAFAGTASWVSYDFSAGNNHATGFEGTAFDGRYVYFMPSTYTTVVRYDTQSDFMTPGSWSQFDTTTVNSLATGFSGGVFDGRYLYFMPGQGEDFVRYDTQASFTDTASWTALHAPVANPSGLFGGVFDGRYIYAPSGFSVAGGDIVVNRYDTQAPFAMSSSWAEFDITKVDAGAGGFHGASFDGRYVYLVPSLASGILNDDYSIVWRYDTQQSFTANASWSQFDTAPLLGGNAARFGGSGFDGRYIYFVPGKFNAPQLLTRVDTQADFTTASSWSTFNMLLTNVTIRQTFAGAVFDGRYLYVLPSDGDGLPRFDAKTPSEMPPLPAFHGSFF